MITRSSRRSATEAVSIDSNKRTRPCKNSFDDKLDAKKTRKAGAKSRNDSEKPSPPTSKVTISNAQDNKGKKQTGKRPKPVNTVEVPCNKKTKRDGIKISTCDNDPIIEHLKEFRQQHPEHNKSSLELELLDQIALEGLSGITLGRLFKILEVIYPHLPCTTDENCQNYTWTILVNKYLRHPSNFAVRAHFTDPKRLCPGPDQIPSTTKGVIIDKEIKLPSQTVKRIAKSDTLLWPVQDGPIMGSCPNYLSRIDITDELIQISAMDCLDNSETMFAVHEKYGLDNIYFVASQELRTKAILPNWADPNVDIKLREYCALELIGKSRTLGTVFPNDKALGRYRIMLEAKGFITQYQESMSSPIEHHLKRFAGARKSKLDLSTADLSDLQSDVMSRLKPGKKDKNKNVNKKQATRATVNDKKNKGSGTDENEDDYDDDDDDDDGYNEEMQKVKDENDGETKRGNRLALLCCNPGKMRFHRSMLNMVYDVIANSNGMTQLDIRRELHMPNFHVRNHLKNLISLEMIRSRSPKDCDSGFRTFFASKSLKKIVGSGGSSTAIVGSDGLAKLTGIMANWDEADLRAKRIIGHKRSSFSQAEDSLLILCRITSVLIEPKLKLSWCVNKRLVRNILHRELLEALDKTSDACLRRIKYLKRLPNNIMSINELTAELQDDPDITKLLRPDRFVGKLNRRFKRLLKCVRSKIPNLLGISESSAAALGTPNNAETAKASQISSTSALKEQVSLSRLATHIIVTSSRASGAKSTSSRFDQPDKSGLRDEHQPEGCTFSGAAEFNDHEELKRKYDLLDCQSVALNQRAPYYEPVNSPADVKFNQVSLVTMAFTLCSHLDLQQNQQQTKRAEEHESNIYEDKRIKQWLLEQFYSNYQEKLVSSVLSKLNKRTLLTRKCSAEQASLYKPKTKMSLKLNQNVLFLLNRHHSQSLVHLAHPISQSHKINLSESNEMGSIALLTSFCSLSSFNLSLTLKIPANVVGIDQGNENFKSLCARANDNTREILSRFMSRCGATVSATSAQSSEAQSSLAYGSPITGQHVASSWSNLGESAQGSRKLAPGGDFDQDLNGGTSVSLQPLRPAAVLKQTCRATEKQEDGNGSVAAYVSETAGDSESDPSIALGDPSQPANQRKLVVSGSNATSKMDDSRRALFLLRHELKAHALDKCGSLADCLIVQPCNVKFYSKQPVQVKLQPLERFLAESKPRFLCPGTAEAPGEAKSQQEQPLESRTDQPVSWPHKKQQQGNQSVSPRGTSSNWLVRSYCLQDRPVPVAVHRVEKSSCGPTTAVPVGTIADFSLHAEKAERDEEASCEDSIEAERECQLEAQKRSLEFEARLWKRIDGSTHPASLFKLIESLLSWIIVMPGIELRQLANEFGDLMPEQHLLELLQLMQELHLIEAYSLAHIDHANSGKPLLFGYAAPEQPSSHSAPQMVYESSAGAYARYCQLLDHYKDILVSRSHESSH